MGEQEEGQTDYWSFVSWSMSISASLKHFDENRLLTALEINAYI